MELIHFFLVPLNNSSPMLDINELLAVLVNFGPCKEITKLNLPIL